MRELLGASLLVRSTFQDDLVEMTCNENNGTRKFRRWCQDRPTWPHWEGRSRLKSTYSTRLAGLSQSVPVQVIAWKDLSPM